MARKRLFITGASGYLGTVITALAIKEHYSVFGLSRTEDSDRKLEILGAVPVRGDLTSLDVLRREAAASDGVIHLATSYTFGEPTYDVALPIDTAAVDAIVAGLAGSSKPLIVTAGTLQVVPDAEGRETDESAPVNVETTFKRHLVEAHALSLADKGIRVTSIRLAPYVYGRGGSGVARMMGMGVKMGGLVTVDGGRNRTTTVHVDDAARLYLLALEGSKGGEVFNASADTDVTAAELYKTIGEAVGVPVRDMSFDEAKEAMGEMVTWFLGAENRASGEKARRLLGWEVGEMGILDEIKRGSYREVAEGLAKGKGSA